MAVKMRLRREGKRKQPFYRVVVADVRSPRDGRFIEDLGYYQPLSEPSAIKIDHDRALYWLRNGVQPSDAVLKLLRIEGIWEEFKPGDPGKDRSAKHEAEAAARREAEAKQAEAEQADAQRREAEHAEAEAEAAREQAVEEGAGSRLVDAPDEAGDAGRSGEASAGEAQPS